MPHTVAIGCDPNARRVKEQLMEALERKGHLVRDFGSDDPLYANVARRVAFAVSKGECERGILLCGTGIGMSLAANKVKGAYAALLSDSYSAERARKSNDANIACFGVFTLGIKLIENLADIFLNEEFEPGCASQPKVDCIRSYER